MENLSIKLKMVNRRFPILDFTVFLMNFLDVLKRWHRFPVILLSLERSLSFAAFYIFYSLFTPVINHYRLNISDHRPLFHFLKIPLKVEWNLENDIPIFFHHSYFFIEGVQISFLDKSQICPTFAIWQL